MTKSIIFFVVIINLFMFNGVNKIFGKDMSKFSYALLIIAILIYTEINLIYPIKYYDKASIGKFKNMVLSSYEENRIKIAKQDIENFEKQNNVTVYILDSKAAKYNIYMERNGDIFDLPLCGNLGHKDYNLLIEKLESFDKHAVMLLHEEEDVFWQQSKEVRKYVLDNYTKAGNAIELNLTDENGEKSYIYDIYLSK